ncbi:ABC transporter ATP-binding protein [uncultured Propionibacterium sp.]|uniref:ABC transporter ATP-binding protein n=1 Tax=uncultured Propionibacterium sp. TaxID=218066 RepID=UPI00292F7733|nr:ABC transporter ATP-binding protein [uncultured Propionibacterium sp.]
MNAPISTPGQTVIEAGSISKSFRTATGGRIEAVKDVSLTVRAGEIVALLGPNGAGKSTTIDMILGLTRPDAGSVRVFGGAPLEASRSGRTAVVAQSGGLLADSTVYQTMRVLAALYPEPDIGSCMDRAGIIDLADRQVAKCSGGEQQRLRFALALLPDPDLLILDEPTAGMDVQARHDFWREIRVEAQAGRTIVFATHYLEEVDEFADRVVLIKEGRVIADDSTDAIRTAAGGCVVSAELAHGALARIGLPGTRLLEERAGRTYLHNRDSDALARRLLELGGREIRVVPRSLDDAFLALTSTTMEN